MTSLHLVILPDDVRDIQLGSFPRLGNDIMRTAVKELSELGSNQIRDLFKFAVSSGELTEFQTDSNDH
jgi:hypothetical protein